MLSPGLRGFTINDLEYNFFGGAQGYAVGNGTNSALTGLQTVSAAPGFLQGLALYNPNASAAYVQVFDTTGAVTLGTTRPNLILPIAASSVLVMPIDAAIFNGIKLAATTTSNGATVVATGLAGTIFFN